jgi:uncharacterized membrane protein YdbT with pleckstrin-like domain
MAPMGYPEDSLTEGEEIVTTFRPHWKLLFMPFVWLVAGLVALGLIFTVVPGSATVDLVLTVAVLIGLLFLVVKPLVDWFFTRYALTTERLISRRGVIARSGIEIPLENINNVNFSQTLFERLLAAGDLLIESAGETGQSRFSNIPRPDEFQSELYRVREERTKALTLGSGSGREAEPDPTEHLERLARLYADGYLTEEEFEAKKQKLLEEI